MAGNSMFRKESLERLSSPERLDEVMKVVSPKAWLPLATMGSLVLVAALWSVFGRIPLNVNGQGVLILPRRVVQIQAPGDGQIISLNIKSGDTVKKGDVIGTVEQANVKLQLEQEQAKLAELERQNQQSSQAQRQRIELERQTLKQQRANLQESLKRASLGKDLREKNLSLLAQNRESLEKNLREYERLAPELRQTNLTAQAKNRKALEDNLQRIRQLLPELEKRLASRRQLLEEQLITGDVLLQAEQEYFNNLAQLSDLETKLKQLEVEETNIESQYLQNLRTIDDIKSQIKEIDVQQTNVEREYLQNLNTIDDLQNRLREVDAQEAKLAQQDLEASQDKSNRILEVKNRIGQLEKELAEKSQIISDYNGRVLEISTVTGQLVSTGTRLGAIEAEEVDGKLMSVIYFANRDGKRVKSGMTVQVTPSIVKRERYGGILGEVKEVSPFPVTVQDMSAVIGNQNLAETLANDTGNAPVQVFAELKPNTDNISGYQWSSSAGPDLKLSPGTIAQVQVKVGDVAPISYVIPIFRNLTGVQ